MFLEEVEPAGDRAGAPPAAAEIEAVQRAVIQLFARWELTDAEAATILGISSRTFQRWRQGQYGRVSKDGAARMSNLMGIHKALRLLFREPARGYQWIGRPNEAFGGRSALAVMLGGELTDIMRVRRYLDAARGSW